MKYFPLSIYLLSKCRFKVCGLFNSKELRHLSLVFLLGAVELFCIINQATSAGTLAITVPTAYTVCDWSFGCNVYGHVPEQQTLGRKIQWQQRKY